MEERIREAYQNEDVAERIISALALRGTPRTEIGRFVYEDIGDLVVLEVPGMTMMYHVAVVAPGPSGIQVSVRTWTRSCG